MEILAARDQIGVGEARGRAGRVRSVEIRERDPLAFGKGGGVARTKRPPSDGSDCHQGNGKKTEFPGAAHIATLLRIPNGVGLNLYVGLNWFLMGSLRMRLPVNAKIAFVIAGAMPTVPGSPMPPGASPFFTRCTSITGASLMRRTR